MYITHRSNTTSSRKMWIKYEAVLCLCIVMFSSVAAQLTQQQKDSILNNHNMVRGMQGSSDMPRLVWDDELAVFGEQWAARCTMTHGQPEGVGSRRLGQNIGWSFPMLDLTGILTQWSAESQNYNYDTNACAQNADCSHFTQIVWSRSLRVGCGHASGCSGRFSDFIVCNFEPEGNVNGQRPYLRGAPCSACASGNFWCDQNNLCRNDCPQAGSSQCVCRADCKNCAVTTGNCGCQCIGGFTGPTCSDGNGQVPECTTTTTTTTTTITTTTPPTTTTTTTPGATTTRAGSQAGTPAAIGGILIEITAPSDRAPQALAQAMETARVTAQERCSATANLCCSTGASATLGAANARAVVVPGYPQAVTRDGQQFYRIAFYLVTEAGRPYCQTEAVLSKDVLLAILREDQQDLSQQISSCCGATLSQLTVPETSDSSDIRSDIPRTLIIALAAIALAILIAMVAICLTVYFSRRTF